MRTWENKIESVIGKLARAAYEEVNFDRRGKMKYKRPHPYRLPEEAAALVDILGWHDRDAAEKAAKSLMEHLRRRGLEID